MSKKATAAVTKMDPLKELLKEAGARIQKGKAIALQHFAEEKLSGDVVRAITEIGTCYDASVDEDGMSELLAAIDFTKAHFGEDAAKDPAEVLKNHTFVFGDVDEDDDEDEEEFED